MGMIIAISVILLSMTLVSVGIILLVLSSVKKAEKNATQGGDKNNGNNN